MSNTESSKETEARSSRDRELFNRIASTYAAKDMHPTARPARRHRLTQTLNSLVTTRSCCLLEVGCGAGFSAEYLDGRYGFFHGIDYAEELVEYANKRLRMVASINASSVEFTCADARTFCTRRRFDGIFMIGVLHHMEQEVEVLRNLKNLLVPGGWIAANEPNAANPIIQGLRRWRKRYGSDYSEDQRAYRKNELTDLFTTAGFEGVTVRGQGFFSTPFAEVPLNPPALTRAFSQTACAADRVWEQLFPGILSLVSWNLIANAIRPAASHCAS